MNPTPEVPREPALLRAIGVLGLAAGIVNVTVGGGIFRLPADAAQALGSAAPLAYLVCALAMGLIVLCFAEAGSRVDLTGGCYSYVEVALGPFAGFLAGILLWLLGTLALAAVSVVLTANVGQLVPALSTRLGSAAFLVAVFGVLAAVNIAGVARGTMLGMVATVAKLVPLLLLVLAGPFFVEPANLAWPEAPAPAAVSRASILLVFAFAGVESALTPSGEVKDVARTVPRAIFIAMVLITVLYVALQLVAQGVLGPELARSRTPLADAAGRMFGPAGRNLLLGGATVSMFGYVSGMTLAVPRVVYALARDGFLPAGLAAVHPRLHTPHAAILAQSVLACVCAVTSSFERLAVLANLSTLVLYAACCAAAWRLRRADIRTGGIPFRAPGAGMAPFAAILVIAAILTGVRREEWAALAIALVAATLLFLVARRRRARPSPSSPRK